MPPPETDAGLPPPPPGLDVVDTHHDIARDIGQQVEAMILDATQQILEKNGKFVEDYRSQECLVVSIVNDSKCMVLGLGMFWGLEVWSTCDWHCGMDRRLLEVSDISTLKMPRIMDWFMPVSRCFRQKEPYHESNAFELFWHVSVLKLCRLDGACAILCPDLVFLSV